MEQRHLGIVEHVPGPVDDPVVHVVEARSRDDARVIVDTRRRWAVGGKGEVLRRDTHLRRTGGDRARIVGGQAVQLGGQVAAHEPWAGDGRGVAPRPVDVAEGFGAVDGAPGLHLDDELGIDHVAVAAVVGRPVGGFSGVEDPAGEFHRGIVASDQVVDGCFDRVVCDPSGGHLR